MERFSNPERIGKRHLVVTAVLGWAVAVAGCSRPFFRNQADKHDASVMAEKDKYPDWKIQQYHVYPDPCARFADQSDPDCPPMPPDDPAAAAQSPNPQNPGKAGIARIEGTGYLELLQKWDAENRAEAAGRTESERKGLPVVETPYSETSLVGKSSDQTFRPYLIKLEQAVELGYINSREYQDAREDLYLTALAVTRERFAFAPQFFALAQAIRENIGSQVPPSPDNPARPSHDWTINSNAGVAQLFSTGALLLFNFANQTVIELTGAARGVISQSQINLDLVQPFLRGGGLAVTLESLTQAERNLVYEIRNFARFQKTFYVAIAGGGGGALTGAAFQPVNVISNPSFSPDAGFGTSGVLPGSVAPVTAAFPTTGNPGLQVSPLPAGNISLQTALVAPVSGYLSTLLEAAQIQVDRYNIQKFFAFLQLAKGYKEIGDLSQLQVDQFEQQLLTARRNLVNDQQDYLQAIDQFKLQLGVPPNKLIELDDTPFRPLNQHFQRYEDLFNAYKAASEEPLKFGTADMVGKVRGELRRIFTTSAVVQGTRFQKEIIDRWRTWEKRTDAELDKQRSLYREEQRQLLDRKTDVEEKGGTLSPADTQRLERLENELNLADFEKTLRGYESEPWKQLKTEAEQRRERQRRYGDVVPAFVLVLTEARNERMKQLHELWPKLDRVCVSGVDLMRGDLVDAEAAATQYALIHRLDLMNVRGQVVDAWRQLAVFANALLGTFNVQYSLNSFTPSLLAKPMAFSGSRTTQQLVLNTELPLVRIQERNDYRAAQINFERARRILQRGEDEVQYDVRQELITLRQYKEFYDIQTRQIELSYMVVENSLDTLQAPPGAQGAGQQATDTATRAAALTTQLINAQNSLYTALFNMTTYWITYLNTRDQLYRDMELMNFDERGMWIDNVAECECPPAGTDAGQPKAPDAAGTPERLPEPKSVVPAVPAEEALQQ